MGEDPAQPYSGPMVPSEASFSRVGDTCLFKGYLPPLPFTKDPIIAPCQALDLGTPTPSPFPRILFWTDWDASLPRIEAASMSGAGRRTIHRETGSGGWPNGLTVDYLEKRILWIDARSAPPTTTPEDPISPLPSRDRVGLGASGLGSEKAWAAGTQTGAAKGWAQWEDRDDG